jgi:4-hydroxy-tetrahydrodipicolinate synthase
MTAPANPAAWLAGYIPDLPTPFDETGAVDREAFARLCERQIAAMAPAIVVCETAGEASTLTPVEHETVIRAAVEIARGRTRVIAGAGSNSTNQAIELTRRAETAGADAVLSVVPYYNKPTQAGIHAHFRSIADSTGLPIILHDIPSRTIRELADDTLARLAESKQFIGLRDASADTTRPLRVRPLLPRKFRLLSGDDATALAFFANGGDGCISVIANIAPELCQIIFSNCRQGRLQSARYLQHRLAPLTAALSKENPAALKYALCLLGFMSPNTRLPIVELAEAARAEVASAIAEIGDEDIACPSESRHERRLHEDAAAKPQGQPGVTEGIARSLR